MSPGILAAILGGFAAIFGLGAGGGSGSGGSSSSNSNDNDGGSTTNGSNGTTTSSGVTSGGTTSGDAATTVVASGRTADAADTASWEGPSAEEQLMVELINRARMDPAAEVDRLSEPLADGISSSPSQPLAITQALSEAALDHSEDMDDRNFFAHTNPSGESPADRAVEAGHGSRYVGENIGWIGSTRTTFNMQSRVESHHHNLWDSDGHQVNMMRDSWSEVGVGYDEGSYRGYDGSTFVTENFSDRGINYLTGVVIDDQDGDEFYDIGEGQGDVRISADNGDAVFRTTTWEAGGYSLALPEGTYEVTFQGGDLNSPVTTTISIGDDNVKLDVIEDGGDSIALTSASEVEAPAEEGSVLPFLPEVAFDESTIDDEDVEEEEFAFL